MGILETTLELLQRISVKIIQPSPKHKCFCGDMHTCQLFCSRFNKTFGLKGPLERVLDCTPVMVLIHYGFLLEERPEQMVTFDMLPPLFSTEEAFLKVSKDVYNGIEENADEEDRANLLCKCLTDKRGKKDVDHFVNFTEAVKIDSHFSAPKQRLEARKCNTRIFLSLLFE